MRFKKMVLRIAMLLTGVAVAGSLSGCSSNDASPPSGSLTPITIGAVYTTSTLPLWVAEQQGFFKKNGMEVTIKQSPNFAASAPALLSGQMQFANAATAPAVTSIAKGMPLQIVAGVQTENEDITHSSSQVMVRKDSTIKRPRDLQGKTVATSAIGSGPYVGVIANYLADGGAPNGIKWVVVDLNSQLSALEKGQVDAIVASEPYRAQAQDAGMVGAFSAYRVPGITSMPAGFTDVVLLASSEYLAKNPEMGVAMQKAMKEATDWINKNPKEARKLVGSKLELSDDVVSKINLPTFVSEVEPRGVQKLIEVMLAINMIPKTLNALELVWVKP